VPKDRSQPKTTKLIT